MRKLLAATGLLLVLLLWPFAEFALTMILWLMVVQIAAAIMLACVAAWIKERIEKIVGRWKNRKGGHYAKIGMDIEEEDAGREKGEVLGLGSRTDGGASHK